MEPLGVVHTVATRDPVDETLLAGTLEPFHNQPFTTRPLVRNMAKSMSAADFAGYKAKLTELRARLRGDVSNMADVALNKDRMEGAGEQSSMPIHMADIGTDNYEQEFTLSIAESESVVLAQIDQALKRIEQETYGECEDCEKPIPKARLNAIPYASRCVKCASETELNR